MGLAEFGFTAASAGFGFTAGTEGNVGFDLSTDIVFLKGGLAAGFSVELFFSKVPDGSAGPFSLALFAFISDNLAA